MPLPRRLPGIVYLQELSFIMLRCSLTAGKHAWRLDLMFLLDVHLN